MTSGKNDDVMDPKHTPDARPTKVFTEAEYRADASKVVAYAVEGGIAVIARPDGSPSFMISIPRAQPSDSDE